METNKRPLVARMPDMDDASLMQVGDDVVINTAEGIIQTLSALGRLGLTGPGVLNILATATGRVLGRLTSTDKTLRSEESDALALRTFSEHAAEIAAIEREGLQLEQQVVVDLARH